MRFIRKKLSNGLRVIAVPMKDNPTAAALVMVGAGSHYEPKSINGISHFLEHMVFKGTTRRPNALSISYEFDSLGASSNAFTGYEYTGYHAKAGAKNFNRILDVVSDLYLDPIFPEKELEREKGVIIQEINLYEDQPSSDVHRVFDELLYKEQPAGRSILGAKENIRAMKRNDFVSYRQKHYVPGATVAVVAGNIDSKKAIENIVKQFGNLKKGKVAQKPKIIEKQTIPQIGLKYKKTDQSHFILGFRSIHSKDKRVPALDVLSAVLGRGMSSRLFQKLREEMGVCYYVRAGNSEHTDAGMFKVATGVDTKRVNEVIQVIVDELRRLTKELVPQKELSKAKEYITGNFLMGLESSDDLAYYYGSQEILGLPLKTPIEEVREIQKVSAQNVMKVAKDIFRNNALNLAIIGPHKEEKDFKKVLSL